MLALDDLALHSILAIEPGQLTVQAIIDHQAQSLCDKASLLCPHSGASLTFGNLRERARVISNFLLDNGLSHGDRVAFLLDNGIYTAELFLAIMYGGFVAVPLNVTAAASALAQTIAHSESKIAFVSQRYRSLILDALAAVGTDVVLVDYDETVLTQLPYSERSECTNNVLPEADALIAYTSGSTGQPKGALFSHANVIAGGYNTVVAHDLTTADKSLCVLPLYHMNAQIVTLMSTLISGGTVVVPQHFNPNQFWQQVMQHHCTWFALVPTIVNQLLHSDGPDEAILAARACVRFARSSSAPLSPAAHQQFEERFKLPMIEAMGMTEAGGAIFSNPLPPKLRKIGSPGIPYGFEIRIVGSSNQDVASGQIGEIFLRGASVMRGYFKMSGPDDLCLVNGWIATGDLGWQDEDGFVFITGRTKDIINKGGEKIVPREIEEFLLQQPDVREAAVIGLPDLVWGQDIAAFVVFKPGRDANQTVLAGLCEKHLGALKTPSRFFVLPSLPKGTVHKINRSALAEIARTANFASSTPDENQNASACESTEQTVLKIMAELLKQPKLQPSDNFFDFGGYSLRAMQLMQRLSRTFSLHIPVAALFQGPTAGQLACLIESLPNGDGQSQAGVKPRSLVTIRQSGHKAPLFFTPGGNGGDEEFVVYANLVRYLDKERPFYGLKARASIKDTSPHLRVEEMAADYIKEIQTIQPVGPYSLAGECSGAVIAYEMACQLTAAGQTVTSVVMMDCRAPDFVNYTQQRLTWLKNRIIGSAGRPLPPRKNSLDDYRLEPDMPQSERERRWLSYKRPLLQYRPKPYHGKVVLLLSQECIKMKFQETWSKIGLTNLQIVTVAGCHYEYIRENAKETATALTHILS